MSTLELFLEVAERAYWRGEFDRQRHRSHPLQVGKFYEGLPEDVKDRLRALKSDDLRNVRPDAVLWMCHPMPGPPTHRFS